MGLRSCRIGGSQWGMGWRAAEFSKLQAIRFETGENMRRTLVELVRGDEKNADTTKGGTCDIHDAEGTVEFQHLSKSHGTRVLNVVVWAWKSIRWPSSVNFSGILCFSEKRTNEQQAQKNTFSVTANTPSPVRTLFGTPFEQAFVFAIVIPINDLERAIIFRHLILALCKWKRCNQWILVKNFSLIEFLHKPMCRGIIMFFRWRNILAWRFVCGEGNMMVFPFPLTLERFASNQFPSVIDWLPKLDVLNFVCNCPKIRRTALVTSPLSKKSKKKERKVAPLMRNHPMGYRWTAEMEERDTHRRCKGLSKRRCPTKHLLMWQPQWDRFHCLRKKARK